MTSHIPASLASAASPVHVLVKAPPGAVQEASIPRGRAAEVEHNPCGYGNVSTTHKYMWDASALQETPTLINGTEKYGERFSMPGELASLQPIFDLARFNHVPPRFPTFLRGTASNTTPSCRQRHLRSSIPVPYLTLPYPPNPFRPEGKKKIIDASASPNSIPSHGIERIARMDG